ncbi:hypothetical protein AVEN_119349-1 [Araneus ventricosus]|uniref:C2H2-type domain-containing protein n=1 Tax=Araneus ventricosus TaxID=182803 RepID=A0A4Y2Q1S6_ARAVE|nr:hypothetical protein AVEN_119349-1 [Araneus ventricosus]
MINLDIDSLFKCPQCQEPYPTELGLRNHVAAHKKADALANATQRIIPKMSSNKWKRKKKIIQQNSNLPDEAISDPAFILAPPINNDPLVTIPRPRKKSLRVVHYQYTSSTWKIF